VVPKPDDALIEPSSPCTPNRGPPPEVCSFGTPAARARATVALVGDSHAVHWRAALEVVARARRWHGLSIYRSRCPLTDAVKGTPEPDSSQCTRWNRTVQRWFRRHPEVHTVFVSQRHVFRVLTRPGQSAFDARLAGYIAAWKALPASVRHVVVIRDVPWNRNNTGDCVKRAIARHEQPGPTCAIPRAEALPPDPAVAAAKQLASRRVAAIDMSAFMCDSQLCYPVVGGVLVHKDVGQLTRLFSSTLGPFLLRAVNLLIPGARPASGRATRSQ
jgi:hypothetical protein